jgi:hypothetical protein
MVSIEAWELFCHAKALFIKGNRENAVLPSLRCLPQRVRKITQERFMMMRDDDYDDVAAAIVESQMLREGSIGQLAVLDLYRCSITSDAADTLLAGLTRLQDLAMNVKMDHGEKWMPKASKQLLHLKLSLSPVLGADECFDYADHLPRVSLALLCSTAEALQSLSLSTCDVYIIDRRQSASWQATCSGCPTTARRALPGTATLSQTPGSCCMPCHSSHTPPSHSSPSIPPQRRLRCPE